jgi:hypothetical protein
MRARSDIGSIAAGLAVVALGTLTLLEDRGAIHVAAGWLLPAIIAAAGIALVASGISARGR